MVPRLLYTHTAGEVESNSTLTLAEIADAWDPEPCCQCGRPASPATLIDAGALCLRCETAANPAVAFTHTGLRLVAARAAAELAHA